MPQKNLAIAAVVLLVILLGGYFLVKPRGSANLQVSPSPTESVAPRQTTQPTASPSAAFNQTTISVSADGFSPADVKIKAGESVTWVNNDSASHQVNSNPHPTHTGYPPLNTIGLLKSGESKSLTFPASGKYGFHDHLNPSFKGSVTVE